MFNNHEQPNEGAILVSATILAGFDPRPAALNLPEDLVSLVHHTVLELDLWLDAMRVLGGYAGPVVHWTGESLGYNAPGLDWRYEGIIIGYLNLWHATSDPAWIEKASRAGDDLVAGQLASGNFRNSSFEWNPNTGATPHEAAASVGLLRLAMVLRSLNDPSWTLYYQSALANIQNYYLAILWDAREHVFYDGPSAPAVSPDRLATIAEALFLLSRLSGDVNWGEKFGLACLDTILAHQISEGDLEGAIHYRSVQKVKEGRFFPHLIARCIPALLLGYAWSGDDRYARAVRRTGHFLMKIRQDNGSYPQVIYANGRRNRWPVWVAPVGDILRALSQLSHAGTVCDLIPSLRWLLGGRLEGGAIRSAVGFGRALLPPRRNDPRDEIASCGWVDKAFRFLTSIVEPQNLEAVRGEA